MSQVRTGTTVVPSHARLSRDNGDVNPSERVQNGLWCCRVQSVGDDADVEANFVFAGVYRRRMGECRGEGGRQGGRSTHQIQNFHFHCSPAGSIMENDVTLHSGFRFMHG